MNVLGLAGRGGMDLIGTRESCCLENCFRKQIASILQGLQDCRQNSLYTDVVLCASGEEFPCHKVVLAASSRYFHAMFSTPFSEQRTSRVELEEVSPWAVRRLLDFAYTGRLSLVAAEVQEVCAAASLLDYPLALEACIAFMTRRLTPANCLGVHRLADLLALHDLAASARAVALENFAKLVSPASDGESMRDEWVQLPQRLVEAYLAADDLEVRSEAVVLEACLAWVAHDPDARLRHLPSLLRLVRLRHLSPRLLRTYIESANCIIKESPAAFLYVKQVLTDLEAKSDASLVSSPANASGNLPRPSTLKRPTLVAVGGIGAGFILDSVDAFSFVRGRCLPCPPLPVSSLTWFSATVTDNMLIVTGGIKAGEIVPTVYRFSVEENAWKQGRDMPVARARHASVALPGGHVFLFGGVTVSPAHLAATGSGDSATETGDAAQTEVPDEVPDMRLVEAIDSYDVARDEWSTVGRSRYPRQMSSVAVVSPTLANDESFEMRSRSEASAGGVGEGRVMCSTVVELGGALDVQLDVVSEKMAIYHIHPDLRVESATDYIALLRPVRYAKCVTNQTGNLVYIFWEVSGDLSVLDFHRQSLRSLRPLSGTERGGGGGGGSAAVCAVHCGCAWVGGRLYVVGGFSAFLDVNQRRPITPRRSIHCYNPETDSWSEVSTFKEDDSVPARAICSCVSLEL